MKKKVLAMAMMGVMAMSLMTGCGEKAASQTGDSQAGTEQTQTQAKSSGQAIRIVNGKIEIDEPLKAFAKKYQEKTGQEVIIESLGGGADINGTLKGYLAAGNMPDLFL